MSVQLYDLHVGPTRLYRAAEDGCKSERCDQCPGNSTCIGSMNPGTAPKCVCHPGLRGDDCDECTHLLITYLSVIFKELVRFFWLSVMSKPTVR